jgi:predicted dienelactone hydrolase
MGAWPTADPSVAGPFKTTTETNVGPAAGEGADGGAPVAFTLFRPTDLSQGGLCHPVVTWGNGTGSSPSLYKVLLNHLASHGFVIIASDSPNVAQGDPPPMVAGVTWVLAQNDDPTSELYQRIDPAHVGATGHSQGGFATTTAGGDSHITTIAALCGASNQRNLHGPALLYCGGMDTTVPCSTIQNAFDAINNQPIMLADYLSADHASWVTFRGTTPSPVEIAVTAWMRVQLMGDTALRSWFYGPDCKLCTDPGWQITQKMLDQ